MSKANVSVYTNGESFRVPGDPIEYIRLGDIGSDPEIQRKLQGARKANLKRNWDDNQCDPLHVNRRMWENGRIVTMDGNGRKEVLVERYGTNAEVRCTVHNFKSKFEEMQFINRRAKHNPMPSPKAENTWIERAEDPEHYPSILLIRSCGFGYATEGEKRTNLQFTCVKRVTRLINRYGRQAVKAALLMMLKTWREDKALASVDVVGGMIEFIATYSRSSNWSDEYVSHKLSMFTIDDVRKEARKANLGKSGTIPYSEIALAMLRLHDKCMGRKALMKGMSSK
jgi:hypothetical protein